MRFSSLKKTIFANVPMRQKFWAGTVPEPKKMADLQPHTKTRLRASKLPTVQADPHSLITVAENASGVPVFFAAGDPVWVLKKSEDDNDAAAAPEDSDHQANGRDDEGIEEG